MSWFLLASVALAADGSALRQLPGSDATGLVEVGMDNAGVAADLGKLRVGLDLGYGSYVGVHLGARTTLTEKNSWGIDAIGQVGVLGLIASPGVALLGTGELRGGWRNDRGRFTGAVVLPLAVSVDLPPHLAVPVGLELATAGAVGRFWVGARAQMGATPWTGGVVAARTSAGVFVGLR